MYQIAHFANGQLQGEKISIKIEVYILICNVINTFSIRI